MDLEEYHRMYRLEDSYWWYQGMQKITFELLGTSAADGKRLSILDAGCGTGGMISPLRKLGNVVGLDFSPEALSLSSNRHCGVLLRGSITTLPFASSSFDLVTCFDVIYHVAVSDDEVALRELSRVLKPGGRLIVRVPAHDFLRGRHDITVHTRHRYSLSELGEKLRRAGLTPIRATYANTILFPLAAAKRIWEMITSSQPSAQSDLRPLPKPFNTLLYSTLAFESWLMKRVTLPFGLSAICVSTKEG